MSFYTCNFKLIQKLRYLTFDTSLLLLISLRSDAVDGRDKEENVFSSVKQMSNCCFTVCLRREVNMPTVKKLFQLLATLKTGMV